MKTKKKRGKKKKKKKKKKHQYSKKKAYQFLSAVQCQKNGGTWIIKSRVNKLDMNHYNWIPSTQKSHALNKLPEKGEGPSSGIV